MVVANDKFGIKCYFTSCTPSPFMPGIIQMDIALKDIGRSYTYPGAPLSTFFDSKVFSYSNIPTPPAYAYLGLLTFFINPADTLTPFPLSPFPCQWWSVPYTRLCHQKSTQIKRTQHPGTHLTVPKMSYVSLNALCPWSISMSEQVFNNVESLLGLY